MTMKTNLQEIEKSIDFEGVTKKLEALITTGGLKRHKKVSDLLDRIKPVLVLARQNKVSLLSLTEFLTGNGIPVSEPSLRRYLNSKKRKKKRRDNSLKSSTQPALPPSEKSGTPAPVGETSTTRKLPPRLARRENI